MASGFTMPQMLAQPMPASSPRSTNDGSWGSLTHILGLSFVASIAQKGYIWESARLFILGTLIEMGRRFSQWLMERFKFQYCSTAQFTQGDPAYEWILLFLMQENVWRQSRDFRVTEKNSKRKWDIKLGPDVDGHAEYVPTYSRPLLFRWKGYWIEIKKSQGQAGPHAQGGQRANIFLSIYTLDTNVLYKFVEETRARYKEVSKPNVTIHIADMPTYGPSFVWSNVKRKARRPLSSIVLMEGIVESLIKDSKEFIDTEQWYVDAGIPHRRGYLLHGPPGTGKTSTIYALAGELGLEIYAVSLSSSFVDDSFLQKAVSSIPKNSIFLLEDIDCAFSLREDGDHEDSVPTIAQRYGFVSPGHTARGARKTLVTLSGLLNVIDGVGSEDGKLFFATTNYIDKLDSALIRPGRIDMKIQYKLATRAQASALFLRFFGSRTNSSSTPAEISAFGGENQEKVSKLAEEFASQIEEYTFSIAELQGFLLSCKREPQRAVDGIAQWVAREKHEREEKESRERDNKRKVEMKRDERERRQMEGAVAKFGDIVGEGFGRMVTGSVGGGGGMVTGGTAATPAVAPSPPTPSPAYEEKKS